MTFFYFLLNNNETKNTHNNLEYFPTQLPNENENGNCFLKMQEEGRGGEK